MQTLNRLAAAHEVRGGQFGLTHGNEVDGTGHFNQRPSSKAQAIAPRLVNSNVIPDNRFRPASALLPHK